MTLYEKMWINGENYTPLEIEFAKRIDKLNEDILRLDAQLERMADSMIKLAAKIVEQ